MYESPRLTTHGAPTPGPSANTVCVVAMTGTNTVPAIIAIAIPTLRMN